MRDAAPILGATPRLSQNDPADFADTDDEVNRIYRYRNGFLLAGAGADRNGNILAGIVYGPPEFFRRRPDDTPSLGDRIFYSISQS